MSQLDWWDNHKQLSKAVKFSDPELSVTLAGCRQTLVDALEQRIATAKTDEEKSRTDTKNRYLAIEDAVKVRYEAAIQKREDDYQKYSSTKQTP